MFEIFDEIFDIWLPRAEMQSEICPKSSFRLRPAVSLCISCDALFHPMQRQERQCEVPAVFHPNVIRGKGMGYPTNLPVSDRIRSSPGSPIGSTG